MAICSHCHQRKPLMAPCCHHCTHHESLAARLFFNSIYYIGGFVGFWWLIWFVLSL